MNRLFGRQAKPADEPAPRHDVGDLLKFASDPASDPSHLGYFARTSEDPAVLAALARNPNTPEFRLGQLWRNDPLAVLENPIVTLWNFSMPGAAHKKVPRETQYLIYQHLLAQPEFDPRPDILSERWICFFLDRPGNIPFEIPFHTVVRDVRVGVRLSLLQSTVKHISDWTRQPVDFPHRAVEALAHDPSPDIALALAMAIAADWLRPDPLEMDFLAGIARKLMQKKGVAAGIAPHVAKWPCLDADLIEDMALHGNEDLLAILVAHPKASESFQERMAYHPSAIVRSGVASSTALDSLIRKLVEDPNPFVRASLAKSRHLSPEIQCILFSNKDSRIILALLENPRTLPELIREIAHLPNLSIVEHLRNHPNTPPDILANLAPP